MKFFIVFFLFFLGCEDSRDVLALSDASQRIIAEDMFTLDSKSVWICYHPGTEFHDEICVEGVYPKGCYVHGDNSKFCWSLSAEDCESLDKDDQPGWREACQKLGN